MGDETPELQRDIEIAQEVSLAEAKALEKKMLHKEQQAQAESRSHAIEREKAQEARIAEIERQTGEEYARKMQEQEEAEFEYMLKLSREEADQAAHQQEMDEMQQAFHESMQLHQPIQVSTSKTSRELSREITIENSC